MTQKNDREKSLSRLSWSVCSIRGLSTLKVRASTARTRKVSRALRVAAERKPASAANGTTDREKSVTDGYAIDATDSIMKRLVITVSPRWGIVQPLPRTICSCLLTASNVVLRVFTNQTARSDATLASPRSLLFTTESKVVERSFAER